MIELTVADSITVDEYVEVMRSVQEINVSDTIDVTESLVITPTVGIIRLYRIRVRTRSIAQSRLKFVTVEGSL